MTWLWIPILLIWIFMMVQGYRRGLVKIILSFLLSVVFILLISPVIEDLLIKETPMLQHLEEIFRTVAASAFETKAGGLKEAATPQLPMLDMVLEDYIKNNNEVVYNMLQINTFLRYFVDYIARFVIKLVAFMISLLSANVLIKVADQVLNIFEKLPGIGWMNRVGGMVFGLAKGVLCLWIFLAVISLFSFTAIGSVIYNEIIGDSYLNFLYQNNWLVQYIVVMMTA